MNRLKVLQRLTRGAGVWMVATALAVLVVLVLDLANSLPPLVSATGLFVIGIVAVYRHRRGFLHPLRRGDAVGVYLPTRLLMIAALYAHLAEHPAPTALTNAALQVGLASVAVATGFEYLIRRIRSKGRQTIANVDNIALTQPPKVNNGPLFPANMLATFCLIACVYVAPTVALTPAILGVLAAVYGVVALAACMRRGIAAADVESNIARIVAELAPVFILHWQAPRGASYQIGMWLPYLERLDVPFIVVVRDSINFAEAKRLTDRPIFLRPSMEALEPLVQPSVRGVFYVNNAIRNAHLVRYPHLTHIQLNHGDSDKAPSFNPVFRQYDFNFVAGQAAIDRFAANDVDMPEKMFVIVGRPQVEDIEVCTEEISRKVTPSVLYAPTWAGFHADSSYSSMHMAPELIEALIARGARVIFRPHPFYNRSAELREKRRAVIDLLERDAAQSGREHLWGTLAEREMSVTDCFNAADAMISDVSSVVGDFLYSEKPLAMIAVSSPETSFTDEFPMARAAYVIDAHQGVAMNLPERLDLLLGADPKRDVRRDLKRYYLGDIPADNYAQKFVTEARRALGL